MKNYKVVIIDDEQLAIDVMVNYLNRYPNYSIEATFVDPENAFTYLQNHAIDIVISDIAMPNISGLDLIKATKQNTSFILVTSYSEYAIQSFELNVTDYLLKPVSFERFSKSLMRFEESADHDIHDNESFFIKEGDIYKKISVNKIDAIKGMKDYAKIYCGDESYLVLKTLSSIETFLSTFGFARIHKSYIIPLTKIEHYDGKSIKIKNHKYPVGTTYKERIKEFLEKQRM